MPKTCSCAGANVCAGAQGRNDDGQHTRTRLIGFRREASALRRLLPRPRARPRGGHLVKLFPHCAPLGPPLRVVVLLPPTALVGTRKPCT